MRNVNLTVLSGEDFEDEAGIQIDANQLVSASFHAFFADNQAEGTFKLQVSNDICNDRYNAVNDFTVTNWVDLPSYTVSVTAGTSALITVPFMTYRWVRAVWLNTGTGEQTITAIADTGVKQVQTVTTIADTGALEQSDITTVADVASSLNDTYFLFSSANDTTDYYVWYNVDGAGTDPSLPGMTGIEVAIVEDDTADNVATASRAAITTAAGADVVVTGATDHIIITNILTGVTTDTADGLVPTGFIFATVAQGAASNLNSTYFTLSSVNQVTKAQKNFYLWLNINSEGVDPLVAGRTAIPVAAAAGASDSTIATAIRAALNGLTDDFVASGAGAAAIITNEAFGPVTVAVDGAAPTGFGFGAATLGVTSNLNNHYFLINRAGVPVPSGGEYYVWFNVDSIGTAPAPSGKTAIAVAISSGASANTIGGLMATAIAAANGSADFSASNLSGVVTVTNLQAGPFVPASDFNSGFTFAVTGGGNSTITVNMNALSL